jgi:hypothetical protein
MQDEEVRQNVDHIDRLELAGDTDRQAFMGELVEHVELPIPACIVGAVLDKVVGPDRIALLRPQPNARSVGQPSLPRLGMGTFSPSRRPKRHTGATLGDMQLRSDLLNAGTATRGAWKFPRAASWRMSLSSVRSETALRSRLFSSSRSFRRFTGSVFSPPNSWRHR